MKHLITIWCPKIVARVKDAHEMALQITIKYGKEDAEVFGAVPQHCPVCDHQLTELEKDGILMEIGGKADKIINKQYPGMFMRLMPKEYVPTRVTA